MHARLGQRASARPLENTGPRIAIGIGAAFVHRCSSARWCKALKNGAPPLLGAETLAIETVEHGAHVLAQLDALHRADPREALAAEHEARRWAFRSLWGTSAHQ